MTAPLVWEYDDEAQLDRAVSGVLEGKVAVERIRVKLVGEIVCSEKCGCTEEHMKHQLMQGVATTVAFQVKYN
jgi:hypothetical protein